MTSLVNMILLLALPLQFPNNPVEQDFKLFECFEKHRDWKNHEDIIIIGDFNFPEIDWSTNSTQKDENHPASLAAQWKAS